ncbi:MAG: aldo/keto reductase [Chloroflexi bacterium]|nr:aldo/keto reductase [Chloroflexota bacterium]OJV86821.1 MAG: hypothetical protein BGO39_13400 [Chloroflexi bacterium 54-19]
MKDTVPKVKVGRTGLEIPRIGLGTGFLARPDMLISEQKALETVRYALSRGINFFDTAPMYGSGHAEKRLGKALAEFPRDSFVIETKVGRLVQPDGKVIFDYSPDSLKRSLEESLERLKMDRVDILLMHDPEGAFSEPGQALEVFPLLADWRAQGVVKAIGAGMNQWEWPAEFARQADFDCFLLAGRYTLLEQKPATEFFPLCLEKGISVFAAGVYNTGILATGPVEDAMYNYQPAPEAVKEKVRRLEAICQKHDVSLNGAALQFPTTHPAVTSLIVGAKNPAEIADNLEKLQQPIPEALWLELKKAGFIAPYVPVTLSPFA